MQKFRLGITKKAISFVLALIMAVSLLPLSDMTVKAETAASDTTATVGSYTIVVPKGAEIPDVNSETPVTQITNDTLGSTKSGSLAGGWYVVTGTVNLSVIKITGDINLILADGASFTVTGRIGDSDTFDHNFTVWAQSAGTGKLQVTCNLSKLDAISANNITVNGGTLISSANDEGGGLNAYDGITVNGGNLTCTGVDAGIIARNNIVINGGGLNCTGASAGIASATGAVTINGGNVTATGNSSETGSGIFAYNGVTINGGEITATGTGEGIHASACNTTITGGTIKAIGSGNCDEEIGTGIDTKQLTISGGDLTLQGGDVSTGRYGSGIAASYVVISGGSIKTTGHTCGVEAVYDFTISGGCLFASGDCAAIYTQNNFTLQNSPKLKAGTTAPGSAYTGEASALRCTEIPEAAPYQYTYVSIIYPTDSVLKTAPAATGSAIYAGTSNALVTAGSTSTGTLKYKVVDSNGTVKSDWSSNLPTAAKLSAGSYKVYYMIVGDDTHKDAASDSWYVDVTVSAMGSLEIPTDKEKNNYLSVSIASTTDDLIDAVLTDEDRAALAAGTDISVWVQAKDISSTISQKDLDKIRKSLSDEYNVGPIMGITLWKQLVGSDSTKVTSLPGGKIKISIQLPSALVRSGREFCILRVHNGVTTAISATVDENNVLVFETDQFSTYAIAYKDKGSSDNNGNEDRNISSVPKTGDTKDLWLPALLAVAGFGAAALSRRKKRSN